MQTTVNTKQFLVRERNNIYWLQGNDKEGNEMIWNLRGGQTCGKFGKRYKVLDDTLHNVYFGCWYYLIRTI